MAGLVSKLNGLVVKHPVYGEGVVIGEDKYSRLIIKLVGGHQIGSISESAIKILSEGDVFETSLFDRLTATGMVGFLRTPYSESKGEKGSLTEGEVGPWACKKCHQTFDPDLPRVSYDKGEKGFGDRKNMICPNCGSMDVKYLADPDDKAGMYADTNKKEVAYKEKEVASEPDLSAVRIFESILEDVSILEGSTLAYDLIKTGRIGTDGVKQLIKDSILKKEDFFTVPSFVTEGIELWEDAVDMVWKSGKIFDTRGRPNYDLVINSWKNMYKKDSGGYPLSEDEGSLREYFGRQGKKVGALLLKMMESSKSNIGDRGSEDKKTYLQNLVSDIESVRDKVIDEDVDAVSKIDEILERLNEDNPWHNGGGRFAKGGHKTAEMWSLYGQRKTVKRGKAGLVKFRKMGAKRAAKIKEWRKSLGPHPDVKSSHKPPYRAKK